MGRFRCGRDCGAAGRRVVRDEAFIAQAMDRWGPAVWRTALMHVPTWADAEDVYQEVFIRLACDATEFADGEHLKAWLLRVALNRCRDLARRRRRRGEVVGLDDIAFEPVDPGGPEADVLRSDEVNRLMWAVKALPAKQREAVQLHYGEGLSCDEVARVLKIKPSAVRMRLKRARERLQRELGGAFDGEARPDAFGVGALHTA